MIDRYLLRYFLAVVDQGNFSRAAARCRVSQPTLSVGIAKLETLLGHTLFERSNRRVALTAAGITFSGHARRIEAGFAEAERALDEGVPAKLIRLGIGATLPTAMIGRAIAAIGDTAGDTAVERLEIVEGRASELRPLLARGRIDALLGPVGDEPHARPLFEEGYAMAFPVSHRLAGAASVSTDDLTGEPMIVRRHCEMLSETSRFFTSRGIRPFMAAKTTSDDRALAYVRAGLAITLMPMCYADQGIAMVPLSGFDARRRVGLLFSPDSIARAGDSAVLGAVESVLTAQA